MACIKIICGVLLGSASMITAVTSAQASVDSPVSKQTLPGQLNKTTTPFIKNHGQRHPDVVFYPGIPGGALFIDKSGSLVYAIGNDHGGSIAGINLSPLHGKTKRLDHKTCGNAHQLGFYQSNTQIGLT